MPKNESDPGREKLMSGEAWRQFCDRLRAAGEHLLDPDFPDDERTRSEGYRSLLRLLNYSTRLEIEAGDPQFPDFIRYEDPHSQWGGPNPDNTYLRAKIDPKETYKIWADVDGMLQVIFSQHEGDMQLEQYGVYHERHLGDFEVDEDGFLELILSPEKQAGNWIPTHPEATLLTIRIYLSDWVNQTAPTFHIERVGAEGVAKPPQSASELAAGLDRSINWIEKTSVYWNQYLKKSLATSTPNVPNEVQSTPGGAENIAYGSCFWDLADDEALVLTCDVPEAVYWGFTIHTMTWLESGDFSRRQTSLTGDQLMIDSDGKVRLALSKEDPGNPNWIDTEGRPQGMLAYRWVWSETMPTPTAQIVKVDEVFDSLPDDHPQVSEAERCEQLSVRREALWNRYG